MTHAYPMPAMAVATCALICALIKIFVDCYLCVAASSALAHALAAPGVRQDQTGAREEGAARETGQAVALTPGPRADQAADGDLTVDSSIAAQVR
jgi:hypothetical protein